MKQVTQEIKEAYFALYWGQMVVYFDDYLKEAIPGKVDGGLMKSGVDWDDYLLLRPITDLTEAEAIEVAKIMKVEKSDFWTDQFKAYRVYVGDPRDKELDYDASFAKAGRQYVAHFFRTTKWSSNSISYYEEGGIIQVTDYLRSIGVATSFRGFTVAVLQEAGVLKLVEINESSTEN